MIKIAYNKENPSLVYEVDSIDRVDVSSTGNSGIIEKYVGTVKDTKNNTESKNVKISVLDFDVKWEEVPIDVVETGTEIHNQEKAVTPTTSQQVVAPDTGYTGLNKVTVAGVTSAIDANITAENIKKDTTILGVTGSLEPKSSLVDVVPNVGYSKILIKTRESISDPFIYTTYSFTPSISTTPVQDLEYILAELQSTTTITISYNDTVDEALNLEVGTGGSEGTVDFIFNIVQNTNDTTPTELTVFSARYDIYNGGVLIDEVNSSLVAGFSAVIYEGILTDTLSFPDMVVAGHEVSMAIARLVTLLFYAYPDDIIPLNETPNTPIIDPGLLH